MVLVKKTYKTTNIEPPPFWKSVKQQSVRYLVGLLEERLVRKHKMHANSKGKLFGFNKSCVLLSFHLSNEINAFTYFEKRKFIVLLTVDLPDLCFMLQLVILTYIP